MRRPPHKSFALPDPGRIPRPEGAGQRPSPVRGGGLERRNLLRILGCTFLAPTSALRSLLDPLRAVPSVIADLTLLQLIGWQKPSLRSGRWNDAELLREATESLDEMSHAARADSTSGPAPAIAPSASSATCELEIPRTGIGPYPRRLAREARPRPVDRREGPPHPRLHRLPRHLAPPLGHRRGHGAILLRPLRRLPDGTSGRRRGGGRGERPGGRSGGRGGGRRARRGGACGRAGQLPALAAVVVHAAAGTAGVAYDNNGRVQLELWHWNCRWPCWRWRGTWPR